MSLDVKNYGQVWINQETVDLMLSLCKNKGRTLEPSCGNGTFSNLIPNCVAIELDKKVAPDYALNMDFFDYPIGEKFDTIIGNPPYVRYQDILPETKEKLDMMLFDKRSNLYLFFIEKCIKQLNKNGELIFIVPRELLKATSAKELNEFIFKEGTITDFYDLGDKKIFKNACPNTIIFRFEKHNFNRTLSDGRKFNVINGQIIFAKENYIVPFNKCFMVKVGAVSGADKIFASKNGNQEFICSSTYKTGKTKRMFFNSYNEELLPYKDELINRKIKKFSEDTWFNWGRDYYHSDNPRIYVNQKTRNISPFFYHNCKAYDGSILAIFPLNTSLNKEELISLTNELNKVNWEELGFVCDGRFLFSQQSLENIYLPESFKKYMVK